MIDFISWYHINHLLGRLTISNLKYILSGYDGIVLNIYVSTLIKTQCNKGTDGLLVPFEEWDDYQMVLLSDWNLKIWLELLESSNLVYIHQESKNIVWISRQIYCLLADNAEKMLIILSRVALVVKKPPAKAGDIRDVDSIPE